MSVKRNKRPNVILITTDQQCKDSLGCYGSAFVRTPHLDAMATGGVQFDRAYYTNAVCTRWVGPIPTAAWRSGVRAQPGLNQDRHDPLKLTVHYGQPLGELYDLLEDPSEHRNLWRESGMQTVKAELMGELLLELERLEAWGHRYSYA